MGGDGEGKGEQANGWAVARWVIGATAGIAAVLTFVGGALMWIRFEQLELPSERAVSVLPKELLLTLGAQSLALPVLMGVAALLLLWALDPFDPLGKLQPQFWVFVAVLTTLGLVVVIFAPDLNPLRHTALFAVEAAGIGIILITAARSDRIAPVAASAFVAIVLFGVALTIFRAEAQPRMEPVAILLEGGRGFAGLYVGESSDKVYFVAVPDSSLQLPTIGSNDRLFAISTGQIALTATSEPVDLNEDDGNEQAHLLLAELEQSMRGDARRARPVVTANPAATFAPLVHLHSEERWHPLSADQFIANSTLFFVDGPCAPQPVSIGISIAPVGRRDATSPPLLSPSNLLSEPRHRVRPNCTRRSLVAYAPGDLTRPWDDRLVRPTDEQGFYLDLDDDMRQGHRGAGWFGNQAYMRDVPVYYSTSPEPVSGNPGLRLTYWMLYGMSTPRKWRDFRSSSHEGDWERVSVLVRELRPDRYVPISVRYHFHDEYRDIPWDVVLRASDVEGATHPVAFAANGTHAPYPRAGEYAWAVLEGSRTGLVIPEEATACVTCPQWQTWKQLLDVRREPWYGFGGAWGRVGRSEATTGPLGPSKWMPLPGE